MKDYDAVVVLLERRSAERAWGDMHRSFALHLACMMFVCSFGLIENHQVGKLFTEKTDEYIEQAANMAGNALTFGKYEQDSKMANGPEDIDRIMFPRKATRAIQPSREMIRKITCSY